MPEVEEAQRALELADQAFARLDLEGAVAHLSAAIRCFTAADDRRRAAMACVRLGETLAVGLGNLTASRAWFARARRLVEDQPACLEQGWVAVAAMGCDVDDPDELLTAAELALDRARRFGDVNLETKALADAGLAHVQAGRVARGMALLDEAMALACGPANDTYTAGKSVCSFFTACYHATDFEKAASWAKLLRQHGLIGLATRGTVFLSSHCDSVQATMLVELGRWTDAEAVLVQARVAFEAALHGPSWHPDIALADLRIRQGRLPEAETLLLGKEQFMQALLPAARLHLARGDHDLARATAARGLRAVRGDRLRAVELLTVLVDAELAAGDVGAAEKASSELTHRTADVPVPALQARAAAAHARVLIATGAIAGAVAALENAIDRVDASQLPWLHATLLLDLARAREQAGDSVGAALEAKAAAAALATLDVVLAPADRALIERPGPGAREPHAARTAVLAREGKWWVASHAGTSARLQNSKGLCYLAEIIAQPGTERHVMDLVDRVEGVPPPGGVDRRALGDAGPALDGQARAAYRRRIEELRAAADEALAAGQLEAAEAVEGEIDQLVAELARAFGLGGRDRQTASAAERARLNVTRALRASIARLVEAIPAAQVLDRRVRTGLYCAYEPVDGDGVRWIVQS
jgi:tetratricopeptide (TPR) repeat protein